MIKTRQIPIQCPQCGNEEFSFPDDVQDDDMVACTFCGAEIILADLKEVGLEQAKAVAIPEAKKAMQDILKKTFKGRFK
ncbi:hypothetical protein [Pseudomonas sp. NFACC36]|uniref:ECs_2282 family putative zinc-binding protein n=1 Tax=Pseudomonas sp. NFACC36 TaxID=1566197 RepID=UPI000CDED64E|nr:hypothetical protein [Pseudomonas sp. NFACC36]